MKFVLVLLGMITFAMCTCTAERHYDEHEARPYNLHRNPSQEVHRNRQNYFNQQKYNDNSKDAKIIQQDYINAGDGYNFGYETSDGVSREEKAELLNPGTKDETLVVHGSYSYVGADGLTYTITYVADENGYRPTGQHIPSL